MEGYRLAARGTEEGHRATVGEKMAPIGKNQ
jgi:hypothetical protein